MADPILSIFQALSDKTRLSILSLVAIDELAAGEIAGHFSQTRTAISQHLTILREAGLISERRDGTKRMYRVTNEQLLAARLFLERLTGSERPEPSPRVAVPAPPVAVAPAKPESRPVNGGELALEVHVAAAPEQVFALLTKDSAIATWLARQVRTEPHPGGIFHLSNQSGLNIVGEYLHLDSPHQVSFSWGGLDGMDPGESLVEWLLEADPEGTRLRLRHHNLPTSTVPHYRNLWRHSALPKLCQSAEGRAPATVVLEPPA
jgi:DNA-binding transcriptional ArsR family regulator/uncharacterized protein YndB with AHSA1/START domain